MAKTILSTAFRVGRTMVLVSLAIILTLFFAMASIALGANGQPLILGSATNTATAVTKLTGNVAGNPALQIVNPNTAAGSQALRLIVANGKPPLVVNPGAGKAINLNADMVDGQEPSSFLENDGRLAQSTTLLQTDAPDLRGDPVAEVTITVPGSQKQLVHVDGSVTIAGTNSSCPCNTSFDLIEPGTGQVSNVGYDQIETQGYHQIHVNHSFAFVANPGTHTYQLRLGITDSGEHSLFDPVLTATTVPFGATGVAPASLSSLGASSTSATSQGNTPK